MANSEIDSELNELLLRITEVTANLHEEIGDRQKLLQEREDLLAVARARGVCLRSVAKRLAAA